MVNNRAEQTRLSHGDIRLKRRRTYYLFGRSNVFRTPLDLVTILLLARTKIVPDARDATYKKT